MRLIDADKLRKDLMESKEKLWGLYKGLSHPVDKQICGGEIGTFTEVILRLDDAHTIDAVPVVRCKNCEYYENGECVNPYIWMSDGAHLWPDEDFYCAKGERRADHD